MPRRWSYPSRSASAALACCLALAACSSSDSSTSIRLSVAYDAAWNLTGYELTVADRTLELDVSETVLLLMPDGWADAPLAIELVGRRGDERWAHGATMVEPRRGAEVEATLVLARLPCGAWCTAGATTCIGDGVAVCEQRDSDQCLEWSEPAACADAAPYCSLGGCAAECIDECAEGERRCAGPGASSVCGQGDGDDCLDWLPEVACAGDEVCSNGACGGACVDECAGDELGCQIGGVVVCGDANSDDCREWGPPAPCGDGETCSDGACSGDCTDECDDDACDGDTYRLCGQYDLDACTDWSAGTFCLPADPCETGACTANGCATAPLVCETPTEPTCLPDGDTLRVYDDIGTCTDGTCSYVSHDIACTDCASNPSCDSCAGVNCTMPSGPICLDDDTLRTYSAPGTCDGGSCSYPHTDTSCAGGCVAGACTGSCGAAWCPLETSGELPYAVDQTAIFTGTDVIVWGGEGNCGGMGCYLGGARLNLATGAWTDLVETGTPPQFRLAHTAVFTGTQMLVWGGGGNCNNNECYLAAGRRFNTTTNAWSALTGSGTEPPARMNHSAVWTGTQMIIWGGEGNCPGMAGASTCYLEDGARYNPTTNTWSSISAVGAPSAREEHAAVWTGTEMIVWGGEGNCPDTPGASTCYLADGGRYNPMTNTWSSLPSAGAPSFREEHTAIFTDSEMLVWGGLGPCDDSSGDCYLHDGGRFDVQTSTWALLSSEGVVGARMEHTAVWTGSEMIVWGGEGICSDDPNQSCYADGGTFTP